MEAKLILVTPEMAKEMLSHNSSNRKLRRRTVEKYAQDMKAGKWNLTGQTITLDKAGEILDGQHRLSAVVMADVPVEFLVVTGAERVSTYDNGLVRSLTDQLQLGGANFPISIASSHGCATVRGCISFYNVGRLTVDAKNVSTEYFIDWVNNHFEEMEYFTSLANKFTSVRGGKNFRKAVIYSTLWAISQVEPKLTREELERILVVFRTGMATSAGDAPLIGFRNWIFAIDVAGHSVDVEISYRLQYAIRKYFEGSTNTLNRYDTKRAYDFTKIKKKEEQE